MWKAGGSTEADANALLVGVTAAIGTYHVNTSSEISAACKLTHVKCNAIGTDGRYIGSGTVESIFADRAGGGAAIAVHPNQVALAITLETGFSRGPAHKGRFYMPCPVFMPGADGLIAVADRNFAQGAAAAMLTAVNANSTGHVMAIMSRKAGAPGHRAVTDVKVGRVLDTQRRRRRSLTELY